MDDYINNGWIPFNRLGPKKDGFYIVWVENSFPKNSNMVVAEFISKDASFISESDEHPILDVLYWREIEAPNINIIHR